MDLVQLISQQYNGNTYVEEEDSENLWTTN